MNFLRFNQYEGLSLTLVVLLFFLKHYTIFLHWGMLSSLREFQVTELPI